MRRALSFSLLLAACSQSPAPLDYQGGKFYGRDAAYDRRNGTELPKYSASNPGYIPPEQAEKYQGQQQYGVAAEYGGVSSSDLAPPSGSPPGGEVAVPAGTSSQTQAPFQRGESRYVAPPPDAAPASGTAQDLTRPVRPDPAEAGASEIEQAVAAPASSPAEPSTDYYSQDMAMMGSDETATSPVAPPPASTSQPAFVWPVKGEVLTSFGGGSDGLDIKGRKGDPIRASADGRVAYAEGGVKSLGNMVILDHGDGWMSTYAHANEIVVKKGDQVVKGQLIGFVGKTGTVDSPRLHFTIRHQEQPVDPKAVLVDD